MTTGGTIVIAGGGTSGHVLPAIAIAEMLEDRGVSANDLHIVGTVRGIDGRLLGDTEYPHTLLSVTGLKRSAKPAALVANCSMALEFLRARRRCIGLLKSLNARCVVSVGGYGSLAPMSAARRLGIRTVVVSYDSRPGLATRRQARSADVVTVADRSSPLEGAIVAGAPVRRIFRSLDVATQRDSARRALGIPGDAFVVAAVGGSLGSALLNDTVDGAVRDARLSDVFWYHVTGERYARAGGETAERRILVPYQHDMAAVYAACDVLVCRAGASTVAEISCVGVPAVIVPWAGAAENHQEFNARLLSDIGAAIMVPESEFDVERLVGEIRRLVDSPDARRDMAAKARREGEVHRAARLAEVVIGATPPVVEAVDLAHRRRLHIVGIGGPGMSALARALHGAGHAVSGSDIRETDVTQALRREGVVVHIGHNRSYVDGCDAVCASTGVPVDNIEMAEARDRGIPALSRAAMLAALCGRAATIAVAGTHGKTTTTSLVATMLGGAPDSGGRRGCGFVVGGDAPGLGTNGAWESGRPFVVEADESDGTHEALPVTSAVITNIDVDHLDHFGTFDAISESFFRFARAVSGLVVLCFDDARLAGLATAMRREGRRVLTYGEADGADVRVVNVEQRDRVLRFDVKLSERARPLFGGVDGFSVELAAQGRHNASNAAAALVLALEHGATLSGCLEALATFGGVGRRFDVRGDRGAITFVDDYAHLPTEIRAVLASARTGAYAGRRVVAVFQPNRFHRMAAMSGEYADAFGDADVAFVTDIYASGTARIEGVTGHLVVDAVSTSHPNADVRWCGERRDLVVSVADELRPGDVCISFGCGDIETFPDEVMREMDARVLVESLRSAGFAVTESMEMGQRTTYKTGGSARVGIEIRSVDELVRLSKVLADHELPVVVLGRGSNMLVADAGFAGVCLVLGEFAAFVRVVEESSAPRTPDEPVDVVIGGATPLPVAARQLSALGVTGFEWAVGVPGTIGGAVRMNAGGHGSDMVAALVDVVVVDTGSGCVARVPTSELGLRFRGSDLADHHVVVEARLRLRSAAPGSGDVSLAEIVRWRRENQPGGQNAGSVFVNPDNGARSAGEIIDRLGLRGLRVGGASVSDKHANFIQADPEATSADVLRVMAEVHRRVLEAEGVSLRSEVRLVGFPPGLPFAHSYVDATDADAGSARLDAYVRANRIAADGTEQR